jgi:uncharacterized membrane protein
MPTTPGNRHQPQNVNSQHEASLGFQDRLALAITSAVGTMYAVYFFIVALAAWMLWQGAIAHKPFDPYPFAFLLFIGNIVQLLLMPLIMVGQNIQGRHAQLRSDEEYKTTLTSFHDLELVLKHLDEQDKELLRQSNMIEQLLTRK